MCDPPTISCATSTQGRLDTDELQERIDACYRAKTAGELDQLLEDLPSDTADETAGRPAFALPRLRLLRLWPILIALVVISAVTGHHLFWIAIVLPRHALLRTVARSQAA